MFEYRSDVKKIEGTEKRNEKGTHCSLWLSKNFIVYGIFFWKPEPLGRNKT